LAFQEAAKKLVLDDKTVLINRIFVVDLFSCFFLDFGRAF